MDSVTLGIFLLLLGAVLSLLTWLVLRILARTRQVRQEARPALGFAPDRVLHADAVITIEAGGRVLNCNVLAREWFELGGREPTLELLARQVRPSQDFLNLCAAEGQARFTLRGRHTEASSYIVPSRDYGQVMMVVMRQPAGVSLISSDLPQTGRAIHIFTELSQNMASSLELHPTLNAVLESVEQLIPADFSEITLWDQEQQVLIPYRFVGMPGVDRRMEQTTDQYLPGEGYSGYLMAEKQALLITNVDAPKNPVYPKLDRQKYPFRSYLGIPLMAGQEIVGTLELASFNPGRFGQSDLETLHLLAGPAAVALHNAVLFEQEQQQARELAGLSRLVQATSSITNPETLISRLVESLHALFAVERLGFLLYDQTRRMLVCQSPFIGIPAEVVDLYRVPVPEASPADHIIKSQDMIIAPQAPTHPALATLGLNQVAEAAGMRDTILVPLNSTGNFLGYLQAANKANGLPFDEDDIRLLTIVAGQVGPLLGNATLLQETRRRVQRSEALRRIASLAGSAATLDEILIYSVQELRQMLGADVAGIYLLDEQAGELRIHLPSLSGLADQQVQAVACLPVDAPDFAQTVTSSQRSFYSRNAAEDEHILPFFRGLVADMGLISLIDVPLVIRDRGVGELILASQKIETFNQSDLVFVATAAGQLAGAVERSVLYLQTDEKLRRRVEELTALTMISRELNSAQNLETLLRRVLEEARRATRSDGGRVLLFETDKINENLPVLLLGDQSTAPVHVLERRVLDTRQFLVLDYTVQADELPLVSGSRSVLIAPVTVEGRTLGVLHLWSQAAGSFDSVAQEIVQALCLQASAGLSSMLRYQDQSRQNELLQRRVETFTRLMETSRSQNVAQTLPEVMQAVARAIQDVTPFQAVLVSIYEPAKQALQRIAGAGFSPEQLQELQHFTQPWRSVQEYFQEQYRYGRTYFIPAERKPVDPPDLHMVYVMQPRESDQSYPSWSPDDLLLLPLHDSCGEPLGLISVDDPVDGHRPDRATLDTLELFASQAAVILENQITLHKLEAQLQDTRQQIARSEKSAEVTRQNLPIMLQKDREQTERLYQLNQRVEQIRAGLETAELVHQAQDRGAALHQLGSELLLRFGWDVALIADVDEGGPRLVQTLGSAVDDGGLNALLGQRNPLRQCIQTGELVLQADVAQSEHWHNTAILQAVEARAFVCFPLRSGEKQEAAVLVASHVPQPQFTDQDEQLFRMLAGQASLALRNIQLITETNMRLEEVNLLLAFTRQLGSLNPTEILDTLIDTALKVAQNADGGAVLLWDAQQHALTVRAARGYPQAETLRGVSYALDVSLPGRAYRERQTLRIDEVDFAQDYNLGRDDLLRYRDATQGHLPVSTLLVPIQSGEQPLGVLVLDDFRTPGGFSHEDQALIDSLAQQTALALENARLFQASERRAQQLQALTEISGEMSASLQTDELIAALLTRLISIVEFDTGTLWLRYGDRLTVMAAEGFEDNEERTGLTVETKDSQLLREMVVTGKPIVVGDVQADERFSSIAENPHRSWLGLPLIAKGDVIGVIALEKTEADYYSPENIQILTAFASQAAISIQNATLFDDSLRRAIELDEHTQRLASLNRFTTNLSSSLEITQILKTIIMEIQRQISCSAISIVLFDRTEQAIVWAETPAILPDLPAAIPDAPVFAYLRETQGVINSEQAAIDGELAPLQPYMGRHGTRSILVVPLATGNELQGAVFIHENRRQRRFSAEEIELARTVAGQAAISVQNARLYQETQLRLHELAAINQISQNISATIDLEELLARLPEQLAAIVDTDNLYLALLDASQDEMYFPLAFENGEPVELPPSPPAGLTGYILKNGRPLLLIGEQVPEQLEALGAQQYGETDAASYLGVPLMLGESVIGVIAVQSPERVYAFTQEDVRLLSTVAAQIAVAIENSRLYSETRQRTADLSLLFDYSTSIANVLNEQKLVEITMEQLGRAFGTQMVAVITQDEQGLFGAVVQEGLERREINFSPGDQNWHRQVLDTGQVVAIQSVDSVLDPEAGLGYPGSRPVGSWVGVPLMARGETFGALSLASEQKQFFSATQVQLISQIGNQLGTALDSARLFAQVQDYASELEERVVERTQQLAQEHQRTETLLRIITELSASLDMDIVLNRTLALINQIVGAEQSTILLVEAGEEVLLRRASIGYTRPAPEGGELLSMRSDEGLAGWVIRQRQAVLIPDVLQDDRWMKDTSQESEHRSAMVVPLMVGEDALGVLMLFHRQTEHFSPIDLDLVQATAKQIAVALNNSKLYGLIRDQAERLGDMLRTQHIDMSRSQAILEAVADGVLVTDSEGKITLFNASAERILQLDRDQVQARTLENFTGLFGREARSWMETIRKWSRQSHGFLGGDLYAEKIELEDGRVVSVHLSPVRLRNEFLGTVSIFRDITHEVEVDRLKSEFVANVSHELRTPMTSIKGYVDILLMGAAGKLTDQQLTFLNVVKSNTERLVVLVNDLLEVSRLEAGKINLNLEPVDLRSLANAVAEEMRQRSKREDRPMKIELAADLDLPRALADPERVRQIIDNLVDNAYHYTLSGGQISIRMQHFDGEIQIDVQDTGIGIPLGDQEQVFNRFYRGEDPLVLETPGTGLGLAVVKTLVEMHHGRIWVFSKGIPGEGSVFSFTLPVENADALAMVKTSSVKN